MPRIIFTMLLLWQLIFLSTIVHAYEEILTVTIKDGENSIKLNWTKTEQLLANEHLPIWTATIRGSPIKHELKSTFIKQNIGKFWMYHDVEHSSAVVYFEKTNTLHGVIDTRYFIEGLPCDQLDQEHLVNGPYIKKYNRGEYRTDHTKPLDLSIRRENDDSRDSFSQEEPPNKRRRIQCEANKEKPSVFYPEILVFVAHDIAQLYKSKGPDYLASIVRHYLIYFNSVDMLMAKLSTENVKIHLNIAGIVIDESNVLPLEKSTAPRPIAAFRDDVCIDAELTLANQRMYIKKHKHVFGIDSFDFFFISTTYLLQRGDNVIGGLAKTSDVFKGRVDKTPYENLQAAIVRYDVPYEYVVSAHELGHLMGISHDPMTKGFYNTYMQCYAIMIEGGKYCEDCLKWSDESIEYLNRFARANRNHCFLLNTPRSLHPLGSVLRTSTPSDQCRCYGFNSRSTTSLLGLLDVVAATSCNKDLVCKVRSQNDRLPFPIDGTPCFGEKVCWNKKCQAITIM